MLDDLAGGELHRPQVGDIGVERECPLADRVGGGLGVGAGEISRDARTALLQQLRRLEADALRRPGDQGDLAVHGIPVGHPVILGGLWVWGW